MRPRFCIAALAACVALGPAQASAAVCLGKSMTLDEIVGVIDAAPGCDRAMKIFQDCELVASGDVDLGAAVEKNCEAGFLDRLNASEKQTYRREMGVCDRKYRNESGTMYLSFTAFCRAEVAQRYAHRARQPSRRSRP